MVAQSYNDAGMPIHVTVFKTPSSYHHQTQTQKQATPQLIKPTVRINKSQSM